MLYWILNPPYDTVESVTKFSRITEQLENVNGNLNGVVLCPQYFRFEEAPTPVDP